MPTITVQKTNILAYVLAALLLSYASCSSGIKSEAVGGGLEVTQKAANELGQKPKPTATGVARSTPVTISGTKDQKARAIGQIVTEESEGLLIVGFAEVPVHGQLVTGDDFFGAHFRAFVTKSIHDLTDVELKRVNLSKARLFQLTTENIFRDDPYVVHMGVQTMYPNIWPAPLLQDESDFFGIDREDPSDVCVASAEDLMDMGTQSAVLSYLSSAECEKIFAVRESQLFYVLEQLILSQAE